MAPQQREDVKCLDNVKGIDWIFCLLPLNLLEKGALGRTPATPIAVTEIPRPREHPDTEAWRPSSGAGPRDSDAGRGCHGNATRARRDWRRFRGGTQGAPRELGLVASGRRRPRGAGGLPAWVASTVLRRTVGSRSCWLCQQNVTRIRSLSPPRCDHPGPPLVALSNAQPLAGSSSPPFSPCSIWWFPVSLSRLCPVCLYPCSPTSTLFTRD